MDEANWPQQFDMEHFKALRSFKAYRPTKRTILV